MVKRVYTKKMHIDIHAYSLYLSKGRHFTRARAITGRRRRRRRRSQKAHETLHTAELKREAKRLVKQHSSLANPFLFIYFLWSEGYIYIKVYPAVDFLQPVTHNNAVPFYFFLKNLTKKKSVFELHYFQYFHTDLY